MKQDLIVIFFHNLSFSFRKNSISSFISLHPSWPGYPSTYRSSTEVRSELSYMCSGRNEWPFAQFQSPSYLKYLSFQLNPETNLSGFTPWVRPFSFLPAKAPSWPPKGASWSHHIHCRCPGWLLHQRKWPSKLSKLQDVGRHSRAGFVEVKDPAYALHYYLDPKATLLCPDAHREAWKTVFSFWSHPVLKGL